MAFVSLRRLAGPAFVFAATLAFCAYAADAPQPDRTVDMAKVLQPGVSARARDGGSQRRRCH